MELKQFTSALEDVNRNEWGQLIRIGCLVCCVNQKEIEPSRNDAHVTSSCVCLSVAINHSRDSVFPQIPTSKLPTPIRSKILPFVLSPQELINNIGFACGAGQVQRSPAVLQDNTTAPLRFACAMRLFSCSISPGINETVRVVASNYHNRFSPSLCSARCIFRAVLLSHLPRPRRQHQRRDPRRIQPPARVR